MKLLNMMKYKERDINKRVTIQQYPQQTSTKNFACQKRKRLRTAFLIFFSLFFESSSTKSTKSTIECIIVKPNLNDIRMKKIELIQSIKQQDPILANAVSKMVDYIQDKWTAPYPSREQTEAVNDYLRSVHADGNGAMNEATIVHRKIATQKITINAIRVLDHDQLDRLQNVLNHIAADKEYYMPEKKYGMCR